MVPLDSSQPHELDGVLGSLDLLRFEGFWGLSVQFQWRREEGSTGETERRQKEREKGTVSVCGSVCVVQHMPHHTKHP